MKTIDKCLIILGFVLIGFILGAKVAERAPTPHECISVCVEEFEKMGC